MALKISDFLIAIVLITGIFTITMLILADGASKYSVTYNISNLDTFQNRTDELYRLTANVSNSSSSISSQNNVFDIIGSVASQGYVSLKATFVSVDMSSELVSAGVGELNLGPSGAVIQTMIITILSIMIFVGVVIALIVKWPT